MSSAATAEKPAAKKNAKGFKQQQVTLTRISGISINIRFDNNLDIPTMIDTLVGDGKVEDDVRLWKPFEADRKEYGLAEDELIIIRGYRRVGASRVIVGSPDNYSATLVETLKKIPAKVYDGLTKQEAIEMVLDHNSMKRIAKSEIVRSVQTRFTNGGTEMDIILEMHRIIGEDLLGKSDKVKELEAISDPSERRKFASKWLHTFVGNYLIKGCKMGPFVREQVLFHYKQADGLLVEGETIHFKANTTAMQALSAAKTDDEKNGTWINGVTGIRVNGETGKHVVDGGGDVTKDVLGKLIDAHKNGTAPETDDEPKPLSKKDLADRRDSFQSKAAIGAVRVALGYEVPTLANDDYQAARRENNENLIKEFIDKVKVPEPVKDLLCQLVDSNVNTDKVRETLEALSK